MKDYVSLLIIILVVTQAGFPQNFVAGRITDSDTDEPVSYVNIGIMKLMKGTVSDDDGRFRLEYSSGDDIVTFSAIGYSRSEIAVRDLIGNVAVYLTPATYEMEEIVVQEKALGKLTQLGHNLKRRGESVGFGSTQLGTEIGGLMEIDRETIIYQAFFTLNNTSDDSLLFRVNLYEFDDGEPVRNLIPENVIVAAPAEPGTFSVNLTKYNIVTDKSVLLILEWIKAVSLE